MTALTKKKWRFFNETICCLQMGEKKKKKQTKTFEMKCHLSGRRVILVEGLNNWSVKSDVMALKEKMLETSCLSRWVFGVLTGQREDLVCQPVMKEDSSSSSEDFTIFTDHFLFRLISPSVSLLTYTKVFPFCACWLK